jgi:NAD(P)-dependent dehydrogenase (short-subunit alcohol dehydrogenase family)
MKLSGLNALVTGGSQGFGRYIVEAFLAEGANVLFCARTAADVARAGMELAAQFPGGPKLKGMVADIADPASVSALFAAAASFLGPLDVVVNNAGQYGPIGPTEEIPWEEWLQTVNVNLSGTLLVSREAIRVMKPRGHGKIVVISGGGATNPMPRFAAYAATKAAVVRLTETLAEELREFHIDVNAVAPGALQTRLLKQVLAAGPEKAGQEFYAKNQKWAEQGAADPRLGAGLCVFLASRESDGITGKLISAQWDPWRKFPQLRDQMRNDIYTLRRIVPEDRGQKWS